MVSVIVPVYNVKSYLRKCLDSIVNQTYKELEILVIDDGSTDGCGQICDEYAKKDSRIKVFHTENKGLSCARNLGLDEAQGEWIGFADSDDWIEPDMYECLLGRAVETGADVVECGVYREYPGKRIEDQRQKRELSGLDAVYALLRRELTNTVWNKMWKKECFKNIRFPEGRVYEEWATTYKVFSSCNCVCSMDICLYHYFQRRGSLSRTHNMNNLVGRWLSCKEQLDFLWNTVDEAARSILLRNCANAAGRMWAYYYDCTDEDRKRNKVFVREVNRFTKQHFPLFGDNKWPFRLRIGVLFPHFENVISFRIAKMINRLDVFVSRDCPCICSRYTGQTRL